MKARLLPCLVLALLSPSLRSPAQTIRCSVWVDPSFAHISWNTVPGGSYILETTINPVGGWQNVLSNPPDALTASSTNFTTQDSIGLDSRFFRVRQLIGAPTNMVLIPSGAFQMGDTLDGMSDALPLHTVYISAFYMDQYDVTLALWQQVFNWATNHGYSIGYGYGRAPDQPVQMINWYDALKWCNARSEMAGLTPCYYTDASQTNVYRLYNLDLSNACVNWSANGYRLPTEAEWEKAARGGLSGHRFPWGDTISESQANYYSLGTNFIPYDLSNTGYNPTWSYGFEPYTSAVDYFAPNGYGLYDMAGNVSQWCWDWYDRNWYTNSAAIQDNTRGPAVPSDVRVFRSGSYGTRAYFVRCASRGANAALSGNSSCGFRCARAIGP